jgi:hypothetical protein
LRNGRVNDPHVSDRAGARDIEFADALITAGKWRARIHIPAQSQNLLLGGWHG